MIRHAWYVWTPRYPASVNRWDRLRVAAAVFVVALVVHGIDHTRRGFDDITNWVLGAGVLQNALAVITVVLVWRRTSVGAQA